MRFLVCILVLLSIMGISATVHAQSMEDYLTQILSRLEQGHWLLALSAALFAIVQLSKKPWAGALFDRIPTRYRALFLVSLTTVGGILVAVQSGTPVLEAVYAGLFIGSGAIALHQAIFKTIWPNKETPTDDTLEGEITSNGE